LTASKSNNFASIEKIVEVDSYANNYKLNKKRETIDNLNLKEVIAENPTIITYDSDLSKVISVFIFVWFLN
jgi:hypothetical protein